MDGQVLAIVLGVLVVVGLVEGIHQHFVRSPIIQNIKWTEDQITEVNKALGHYTEVQSTTPDPQYPVYIDEARDLVEYLVGQLKHLEFELMKHDHFVMSLWSWFGQSDEPLENRMRRSADYRVDVKYGRVDPFLMHLRD